MEDTDVQNNLFIVNGGHSKRSIADNDLDLYKFTLFYYFDTDLYDCDSGMLDYIK